MNYRYQQQHPSLTDYIRTVLIIEGFAPDSDSSVPLFTNGMPALYCRIQKDRPGDEQVLQLTLFGQSVPEACWTADENSTVIAYFFKPFALTTLFNVPASQLVKSPVDLFTWNVHQVNALRTQLCYAASTAAKVEALDNLLIHLSGENHQACNVIRFATDHMMENSGPEMLAATLKKLNIHERTFQRMFKKYVGVTASHYRRICQFQLSFEQVRSGTFDTLTDVAFDNGFTDQSHFIRSFREHTSVTPRHYLKSGLSGKK